MTNSKEKAVSKQRVASFTGSQSHKGDASFIFLNAAHTPRIMEC